MLGFFGFAVPDHVYYLNWPVKKAPLFLLHVIPCILALWDRVCFLKSIFLDKHAEGLLGLSL